jgi:hypothetical protein
MLAALAGVVAVGVLLAGIRIDAVRPPLVRWPRILFGWTFVASGWLVVVPFIGSTWHRLESRTRFVAAHVAGVAGVVLLQPLWLALVVRLTGGRVGPYWARMFAWLDTNVVIYVVTLALWWVADQRRRALAAQLESARLVTRAADARLQVLTLQLQPHFIFNALNLVSQLGYRNVNAAVATLHDLRSLLAESLTHTYHRVRSCDSQKPISTSSSAVSAIGWRYRSKLATTRFPPRCRTSCCSPSWKTPSSTDCRDALAADA